MTRITEKPPLPASGDPARMTMRTAREWREIYATYPPLRKALLFTGKVGMLFVIALCLGLALFAPPTVLSDHPGLAAYVDFMAGCFGSVRTLSVGALHPQVSQLVLAAGWSAALIPFAALLLHMVIYVLVLDYPASKANITVRYEILKSYGNLVEILAVPFGVLMFITLALGDLGIVHALSFIRGIGLTKAENTDGAYMSQINMLMYTSRWGLGIVGTLNIFIAVGLYSFMLPSLIFLVPLWLSNMRRRLTRGRTK